MKKQSNTPKIRFHNYKELWECDDLKNIFGTIRNAFVGTATPYYVEKGHFYLESNNVKNGKINYNSQIFINDEFYEKIINIVENKVEDLDEIIEEAYKLAKERDLKNVGKKYKDYYEYILNQKNR